MKVNGVPRARRPSLATRSLAFARWHIGQIEWSDALRSGAIEVKGSPALARALPTWNRHGWATDDPRAGYDGSTQHPPAPTLAATT